PISGKEFLEKIVQLPFNIPVIPQVRVRKVLFAGLDKIIESLTRAPFDEHRWGNMFAGALSPFFSNLRSVNRFLSTFAVHVGLFRGTHAFEVNIIDLLAVEVLRVFEPQVYDRMAVAKTVLTAGTRAERGAIPADLQAIFDAATEHRRES